MITIDIQEKGPGGAILKKLADEVRTLRADTPDGVYSYDIHVQSGDRSFRFERKVWDDLVQSWVKDGKLHRQLSYVDALIVEKPPTEDRGNELPDDDVFAHLPQFEDAGVRAEYGDMEDAIEHHLLHLNMTGLPVIRTAGPNETMKRLRYFERTGHSIDHFRENRVKDRSLNLRQAMLSQMPRINVDRVIDEAGTTLGEDLERRISWELVADAMGIEDWTQYPRIGKGIVDRIVEELLNGR